MIDSDDDEDEKKDDDEGNENNKSCLIWVCTRLRDNLANRKELERDREWEIVTQELVRLL